MDVPLVLCILILTFGSFFVVLGILCAIDNRWIKRGHKSFAPNLFCKFMPWHNGDVKGDTYFDGVSVHRHCSRCGKEVMQDGQGNWF